MGTGTTVAIVAGSLAVVGLGVGGYVVLRRRAPITAAPNQTFGRLMTSVGAKAASVGAKTPASNAGSLIWGNLAGGANKILPGSGQLVVGVGKTAAKVGAQVAGKAVSVAGKALSKLKFW